MWNGAFNPNIRKGQAVAGSHRQPNPTLVIGRPTDPRVNEYELKVNFDHECKWDKDDEWHAPPSNDTVYIYLIRLRDNETVDSLQEYFNRLHTNKKTLRWLIDSLDDDERVLTDPLASDRV